MNTDLFLAFKYLCVSALVGMALSIASAFIKVLLKEMGLEKNKIITFIFDLLYILIFTVIFVLMMYYFCDGKFRGMFIISTFCGSLIYNKVFYKICNRLFKILIFPIKFIVIFLYETCKNIISFFVQAIAKFSSKLYNKHIKNKKLETISERKQSEYFF